MSNLKERYQDSVKKQLAEQFNYANPMQVPAMKKIVVNLGIAEASKDKNLIQDHVSEVTAITGQKPVVTKARKAISNFKLREDQPIGIKVTLRGQRMYDFMERFCNLTAPRIRDFRGFNPKQCDGRGNYSLGLSEQAPFYEVKLDNVKRTQGMQVTFVTSAQTDEECVELLRLMGLPFKGKTVVVPQTQAKKSK